MFFDLEGITEDSYQPLIHNLYLECVLELVWSVVLFWAYVTEVYHLTSQWSSMVVGCSYYLDLSYGCQLIHLLIWETFRKIYIVPVLIICLHIWCWNWWGVSLLICT